MSRLLTLALLPYVAPVLLVLELLFGEREILLANLRAAFADIAGLLGVSL